MLTPYSPKTGLYWPPVVARVGRRPWRCRCGLPYWWPPVLAAAVAVRRAGVRPWWLVCWLAVLAAGVRPPCWRSVRGWCPSVAVVAVFVAAGGLSAVRRSAGPPWSFRGPWRPVWALCACLTFGSIPPPLVARRRWCAVLVLACLVCAVGGRGGRVAGRPCWCRWCRCHCGVPWSVVRVAGRQCWPPCWRCCWWCHCAVPYWAVCRGRPSVLVSAVAVAGRVRPSLLVCWCAVGGWRPFFAVFRGRGGPFGPSVVLVSVAGPCGPCGPCFGPCWLAGRVGLASGGGGGGWRCLRLRWYLPISKSVGPCWLAVGRVRCFPWWWCPLALLAVLAGVAPAAAVAVRLIKGPTPAAAVAALLVVCVTCLRWRRRRWRRWPRPCASRPTCGGRRSACRRCGILKRRRIGWR